MRYRDSNVIFYASILKNNQEVRIVGNVDSNVVEITYIILDIMSLDVKGELI